MNEKGPSMKLMLALVSVIVCGACYADGWFGVGYSGTATTNAQKVSVASVDGKNFPESVSIYNAGTNTLKATVNSTIAEFNIEVTAERAICIPADSIFTFYRTRTPDQISSVCFAASTNTSLIYIAGY